MRTISLKRTTVGNIGTPLPSIIQISFTEQNGNPVNEIVFARVRLCLGTNGYANASGGTNTALAASGGCTLVETHTADKDLTLKSSIQALAGIVLTVSGVVVDAQTVTLGTRVYEFDTHTTSTITAGRVRVNISASATKSAGILTMDTQPTAGDTATVGDQTYVFLAAAGANSPGEISVGTNLATAKLAFVAAINGTDSINTANPKVSASAFSTDVCTLTAKAGGVLGDLIVTTETFTAAGNVFNAATLGTTTAGVDCSAANAITALNTAVNADASRVVAASGATSTTLTFTAIALGTAGNAIVCGETMTNGAFAGGAVLLTGGTNNVHGKITVQVAEDSGIALLVRAGPSLLSPEPTDWTPTLGFTHV